MTEFPDEREASPWTPPQQPIAGSYPPVSQPYPPGPQFGGTPPPWPQPYSGFPPSPPRRRNGLAIASLVLGIVALLLSWVPGLGVVLGIFAVVTGVQARGRVKRGEADNKGAPVAGLVLAIVAIIISGVLLAGVVSYENCIEHAQGRYEYGQC